MTPLQTTASLQKTAMLQMALCAALWSIAGIFIKLIPWNAMVIAGFRSLIAGLVLLVYIKASGWRVVVNRQSLISSVFLALTFICFVLANKLTTAANAIVLEFTAPVFIVIISAAVYHQRFARADLVTVLVTMFGISLFFLDQLSAGRLAGNLIAIFAGLCMAFLYILVGKCDEETRMSGILLGHVLTALIGVPFAFFTPVQLTARPVLSILTLGVVQLGLPYVLYGRALKHCSPLMCSLIGAVEPLLNPVWVFLFDGERPGLWALVGGVIVIGTVTAWCMASARLARKGEMPS